MNPPDPIPVTPMHELYRKARKMGQKRRLELAWRFLASTRSLDAKYGKSVRAYETGYSNAKQAFHPTDRKLCPLPAGDDINTGYDLARILAHPPRGTPWKIVGVADELAFRFVDYEVPPLRTTGGARWGTADGLRSRGPVADLLLVADDGTPVIGEVKVVTGTRYDTDHVMALIQGLLLTAALATPQQKERLAKHYKEKGLSTAEDRLLGLYVLTVRPPTLPEAKYQDCLKLVARQTRRQAA